MNKNKMYSFMGFLRLYRGNCYSIILTLENNRVKYAILDSHDRAVEGLYGVDWYDLVDVMKALQLLECESLENMVKNAVNKLFGGDKE